MAFIFSKRTNKNKPINLTNVFTLESKETIGQAEEATITFYPIHGDKIFVWFYETNEELHQELLSIYNVMSQSFK